MAIGFWKRYYRDLLRNLPLAQDLEIRKGSKKLVNSIKRIRRLALEIIPIKLQKEHNINEAFKDEGQVNKNADAADKAAYDIGFNTGEQALTGLKHIEKLEKLLSKVRDKHPSLGKSIDEAEVRFQRMLNRGFFLRDKSERDLYLKVLGVVMKIAEKDSTDPTVMQELIQLAKTKDDISQFSTIAFKFESKQARKAVKRIGREDNLIEKTIKKVINGRVDEKNAALLLKKAFKRMIIDLNIMFENTYKLWRRNFFAQIVLLRLLDETEKMESGSIKDTTAPTAPTGKNMKSIEEIKAKVAEHAHFMAQEFRILMSKEKSIRDMTQKEGDKAQRGSNMPLK